MAVPTQKFREIVFQMLYSFDLGKSSDESMIELLSHELEVPKKTVREAQSRVHEIRSHQKTIDNKIGATSQSYSFERIQTVERNILRLAVFELLYDSTIPHKVAIAEAIRLAKKFATKESSLFINAILDAIYKASQGETPDIAKIAEAAAELTTIETISQEAALNEKKDPKPLE